MIRTLSQLEIAWIAICIIGLLPQMYILWVFTQSYIYLIRRNINSDRKLAARERLRHAITIIGVILGFLVFGIVAAAQPDTTSEPTLNAKIFTAVLLIMNIGVAISGILGVIALKQFESGNHRDKFDAPMSIQLDQEIEE